MNDHTDKSWISRANRVVDGPAHWYRLRCPSNWTVERQPGKIALRLPDDAGILAVTVHWTEPGERPPAADDADLNFLNATLRFVRRMPDLPIADFRHCVSGEATPNTSRLPIWKRLFARRDWRRFRSWVFRRARCTVILTFIRGKKVNPQVEALCSDVVNSLELSDIPADPPERFSNRMLAMAKARFPDLECVEEPNFQISVGTTTLMLSNFYKQYAAEPLHFDEIASAALDMLSTVEKWSVDAPATDLDTIRRKVMPMLYPAANSSELRPDVVSLPWVAGLRILLVIDEPSAYWMIRQENLQQWGLTADELLPIALENLDKYFEAQPMQFSVSGIDGGPRLLLPTRNDAFNATRVLSEKFHESLRSIFPSQFVVGIPCRDFFVAVDLESEQAVEYVQHRVTEDIRQLDHPLTDKLLIITLDGVSQYIPWNEAEPTNDSSDGRTNRDDDATRNDDSV